MIIGIDFSYSTDEPPLYECVTLGSATRREKFATGDPVADYNRAVARGRELYGDALTISSSCDEFATLMNGAIEWTDDNDLAWAEGCGPHTLGLQPPDILAGMDSIFDGLDDVEKVRFSAGDIDASYLAALEELADLHNYLGRLFTGEATIEEVKAIYDKAWPLPAGEGYVPRGLVALRLIEKRASDIGHQTWVHPKEVMQFVADCFRFAHVGLGFCDEPHDDWVDDMINAFNESGLGRIDVAEDEE